MKLLTKASLLYLLFAIPVLAGSAAYCYYLIRNEAIKNTDERLMKDFLVVKEKFLDRDSLADFISINDEITVRPAAVNYDSTVFSYNDTLLYDEFE